MSNLVQHAERELRLAGMYDEDADYGAGTIAEHVLKLVRVFAEGSHSGGSAMMTVSILEHLLRYQPLTPLTSDPEEWTNVSESSGEALWQSRRRPDAFSKNGGQTWYYLEEEDLSEQTLLLTVEDVLADALEKTWPHLTPDERTAQQRFRDYLAEHGKMLVDEDPDKKILDLINFLEWLDYTGRLSYADDDESHEITAQRYLAGDEQRYGTQSTAEYSDVIKQVPDGAS